MVRRPRLIKQEDKPVVPEHTCPYIDMIKELLDYLAEEKDPYWRRQQCELAGHLLEHVRVSNEKLRESGKFWNDEYKKLYNKVPQ